MATISRDEFVKTLSWAMQVADNRDLTNGFLTQDQKDLLGQIIADSYDRVISNKTVDHCYADFGCPEKAVLRGTNWLAPERDPEPFNQGNIHNASSKASGKIDTWLESLFLEAILTSPNLMGVMIVPSEFHYDAVTPPADFSPMVSMLEAFVVRDGLGNLRDVVAFEKSDEFVTNFSAYLRSEAAGDPDPHVRANLNAMAEYLDSLPTPQDADSTEPTSMPVATGTD